MVGSSQYTKLSVYSHGNADEAEVVVCHESRFAERSRGIIAFAEHSVIIVAKLLVESLLCNVWLWLYPGVVGSSENSPSCARYSSGSIVDADVVVCQERRLNERSKAGGIRHDKTSPFDKKTYLELPPLQSFH